MTALFLALALAQGPAEAPAALSARALELAQQKRLDEAGKLWKQALRIAPDFFPALFNLGWMHYSRSEFAQAEPYLARAVKAEPKDFNARYVLGGALSRLGRTEEALRQWRAAGELRPGNVKLLMLMAVEYGKGRYFRDALDAARRALALQDDDPSLYFLAIKAAQDAGDHAAALGFAERATGKFPDLARANFEYGFELHRNGRSEEGVRYIKKAMERAPDYEEPFFFYAEILMKQERHEEAIPYLRRAIELRRDYMAAWTALGKALLALNRDAEALREMRRAVEIDPNHPQPHLLLSQIYFRLGREDEAAKEKQASLRLRRENPTALEAPQGRAFPQNP